MSSIIHTKGHFRDWFEDATFINEQDEQFRSLHSLFTSEHIVVGETGFQTKCGPLMAFYSILLIIVLFCILNLFFLKTPNMSGACTVVSAFMSKNVKRNNLFMCDIDIDINVKCEINTFHTRHTHKHFENVGMCA